MRVREVVVCGRCRKVYVFLGELAPVAGMENQERSTTVTAEEKKVKGPELGLRKKRPTAP